MTYHFIFAVDPGITTGLCYGIVDRIPGATPSDLIMEYANDTVIEEVYEKDEVKSGVEIATLFLAKRSEMMATTRPRCSRVTLVVEDFQLRPGGLPSRQKTVTSPIAITAAIETVLLMKKMPHQDGYTTYVRRQPGNSKQYASDARLREWDVFAHTRGKQHGRDALRHWCAQVAGSIGQLSAPAEPSVARPRVPRGKPKRGLKGR